MPCPGAEPTEITRAVRPLQASDVFEFVGLRSGGLPSASDFQTKYRVAGVNLEQSEVQNIINAVDYVCR